MHPAIDDVNALHHELATLLVAISAKITLLRRSIPPTEPPASDLRAIDDALGEPIELARKLGVAVQSRHGGHRAQDAGLR